MQLAVYIQPHTKCLSTTSSRCFGTSSSKRRSSTGRRRAVTITAAAAAVAAQHGPAQALSVVLLLAENVRRQTGRPLLQREQMLKGVEIVDAADYACIVLGRSSNAPAAGAVYPLLFGNQAARDILACQHHKEQRQQQEHHHHQQQQQHLSVPAAVSDLLREHIHQHPKQQRTVRQQPSQQQAACKVLQGVRWAPNPAAQQQQQHQHQQELCIPQLLCVPLQSPNDAPFGVALLFDSWSWGDGAVGVPGWPLVLQADIPTEPDLQAAADAVRAQADAVRALKTQQGLGNKDPAVVAAVAQLQALKEQLSRLEGLQQAFAHGRQSQLQPLLQALQAQQPSPPQSSR